MWKSILAAAALLIIGTSDFAHAANCSSYPYTLTNGQPADANQVMANFNNILSCGNNSLLGKNNNLSDLQSPTTARANLGLGTAAVENTANATAAAVIDDGSGNLVVSSFPTLHAQAFGSTGIFTIPSSALASTVFKFTVIGGGGGGGSGGGGVTGGVGGASGGAGYGNFYGFTAGQSVTINIGTAGTAASGGLNATGGTGGSSTVVASANTLATSTGGAGGLGHTNTMPSSVPGSFAASSGGGITLQASIPLEAQPGGIPITGSSSLGSMTGEGGSNPVGAGGGALGLYNGGSASVGSAGTRGGGGAGGIGNSASGSGGAGYVIVEWVL